MGRARHVAMLLAMCSAGKTEDLKGCDQFVDKGVNGRENTRVNKRGEWIWI